MWAVLAVVSGFRRPSASKRRYRGCFVIVVREELREGSLNLFLKHIPGHDQNEGYACMTGRLGDTTFGLLAAIKVAHFDREVQL